MQVNRLNLIFPPGSASPASVPNGNSDALATSRGKAQVVQGPATPAPPPAAAPQETSLPAEAVTSVKVELGSAEKTAAAGLYTRSGVMAGRSNLAVDQTPAEQFVASAVNILRDFDSGTMSVRASGSDAASTDLPMGRFASLRQAVGKLNVFA